MASLNDMKWQLHYEELKAYLEEHRQLPDKKKVDNRGLLNWWKYNKKLAKSGKLSDERRQLLCELNQLRLLKDDRKSVF